MDGANYVLISTNLINNFTETDEINNFNYLEITHVYTTLNFGLCIISEEFLVL